MLSQIPRIPVHSDRYCIALIVNTNRIYTIDLMQSRVTVLKNTHYYWSFCACPLTSNHTLIELV